MPQIFVAFRLLKGFNMRSLAREAVYKYLYATQFNTDTTDAFLDGLIAEFNLNAQDQEFAKKLVDIVKKNYSTFVTKINMIANDYSYKRIYSTVRCALLIGMAEIYASEIDVAVAVKEAVKLAQKYSTDESIPFINGILAEYARERQGI